ncbi:centromere protein T [Willisornis vidua]|uniref:Centromere protein T n=1 Tax=Willisornis vidua TaxID=1566151 RepID=A0ABQ9DUB5_9PASS|nr:centromere protein T [Willisornis vidua]
MAEGSARGRPGLRSGRTRTAATPAAAQTSSNAENNSNSRRRRSSLVKRRWNMLPDPDDDTPRVVLKRVIHTPQNCLVDSQSTSGIRTTIMTSDVEIVLNNTELFVQPQLHEQSQNKLSTPDLQLLDSKSSAQRSKNSDAAEERTRPEVSGVGTSEGRTQRHSDNPSLDSEHGDRTTHVSPETPANQQEDQQDLSQQSNPMEQVSVHEEEEVVGSEYCGLGLGLKQVLLEVTEWLRMSLREVVSHIIEDLEISDAEEEMINALNGVELEELNGEELEIDRGVGAKSLDRHSDPLSSPEKSGINPLEEADEEDVLEDQAIMLELDDPEQEPAEDETEHSVSQVKNFKSEVRQCRLDLEETVMSSSQQRRGNCHWFSRMTESPLQLLQPKPVPKRSRTYQRKPCEPQVARSLIKEIFSHFVKMPVTRDAFTIVEKCSQRYFKQLSSDLEAYSNHAGRKTVEMADLELLMRRQGLVTDKMPLRVLIERYLPLEYRKLLIPLAVSGNKVTP